MSAWSSERRLRTERDHNYFESVIQAISCHQFVEVFLSWSVCIIKSTLHTHLIWRQFRACRICTCMRRKTKHIQSASPCALEHCAFFNCITSVRLLSRAGYKLKHFEGTLIWGMVSASAFITGTPPVNLTKRFNIKNACLCFSAIRNWVVYRRYWYDNLVRQFGTFIAQNNVSKTNRRNKIGKILFTEIVSLCWYYATRK